MAFFRDITQLISDTRYGIVTAPSTEQDCRRALDIVRSFCVQAKECAPPDKTRYEELLLARDALFQDIEAMQNAPHQTSRQCRLLISLCTGCLSQARRYLDEITPACERATALLSKDARWYQQFQILQSVDFDSITQSGSSLSGQESVSPEISPLKASFATLKDEISVARTHLEPILSECTKLSEDTNRLIDTLSGSLDSLKTTERNLLLQEPTEKLLHKAPATATVLPPAAPDEEDVSNPNFGSPSLTPSDLIPGAQLTVTGDAMSITIAILSKIRYLIRTKGYGPGEILVLSPSDRSLSAIFDQTGQYNLSVDLFTFAGLSRKIVFAQNASVPVSERELSEKDRTLLVEAILKSVILDETVANPGFTTQFSDACLSDPTRLVTTYFNLYKSHGYTLADLPKVRSLTRAKGSAERKRFALFFTLFEKVLLGYEEKLAFFRQMDPDDLLYTAADRIESGEYPRAYCAVFVPDFEKLSHSRMRLLKALSGEDAEVYCFGDDRRGIHRVKGCDLSFLTFFGDYFPNARILTPDQTCAAPQELLDIAEAFRLCDTNHYRRVLKSNVHVKEPVTILEYSKDLRMALKKAAALLSQELQPEQILVVCRNEQTLCEARRILLSRYRYRTAPECIDDSADAVIIVQSPDKTGGFPDATCENELIYSLIDKRDAASYGEERRIFCAALTVSRGRVIILSPSGQETDFIASLKADSRVVVNSIHCGPDFPQSP